MIKIEWDHDFRDGSFNKFRTFDTWEEVVEHMQPLAIDGGEYGEVFCISIVT